MPGCRVCTHPAASAIDAALTTGSPTVLQLSATHTLSRDILNYHRRAHVRSHPHADQRPSTDQRLTTAASRQTGQRTLARERFIEIYADSGNLSEACRKAKVNRSTVYEWQEHDPEFALAFKQAGIRATESLEREAWRRAREGFAEPVYQHGKQVGTIQRYSDALLMFLLKARAPERYRDRVDVSVTPVIKAVAGFDPASVV